MHFFITGATGYVGSVVTEKALAQGHIVHGLSRSEEGAAKLRQLGATPVHGDLTSLDVLQEESAKADVVLHLAFIHDFAVDYDEILRIDAAALDAAAGAAWPPRRRVAGVGVRSGIGRRGRW